MRRLALALLVVLAPVLFAPATALANVPVLEPRTSSDVTGTIGDPYPKAVKIAGPDTARAVYGYLGANDPFDSYSFTVNEPVVTTVTVLVPARSDLQEFRPAASLLSSEGILLVAGGTGRRSSVFEPLSLTSYTVSGEIRTNFRPGVRYVLRVAGGIGKVREGPYVVAFGDYSRITPKDLGSALIFLPRIWLGLYGDSPPRLIPLLLLAAIITVVAWLIRDQRRIRREAATISSDG
jgi:hypothetical protein